MGIRTIADHTRNEPGLVDRYIGTAFDIVKGVYDNLDRLTLVLTSGTAKMYSTYLAGVQDSSEGDYFAVMGPAGGEIWSTLYQIVGGDVVTVNEYPSTVGIDLKLEDKVDNTVFDNALQIIEDNLTGKVATADLASDTGGEMVGIKLDAVGAVDRNLADKLAESVSLGDFLLVAGGNPRDALEKASAHARVVNIYGGTYLFDQAAEIADDTTIIGHGCTIGAVVAGYTDPNLMIFLGSGEIAGTVFFVGTNMPSPPTSWAGVGIPIGSAIFASGVSNVSRDHTLKLSGVTFTGFRGGPVFVKWLDRLEVDGCTFIGNQLNTLQYKEIGNYVHIPTTNVLGLELITNQNIEAYQTTEAIVTRCTVRNILSKGISLNVDSATTQGNIYSGASPRHCMEHLTGCTSAVSTGNQYDGGDDMGDACKPVNCISATIGGGSMRNCLIGIYAQDCDQVTLLPIGMDNVANPYWGAHSSLATTHMEISGAIGEVIGDGTGNFLSYSTDVAAVAAGYAMKIRLYGGHAREFAYGSLNKTSGLGMTLDLALTGGIHFENCATGGLDLRARNIEIDGKFTNVHNSLSVGSTIRTADSVVTPSKNANIRAVFENCTGDHCRLGAQAVYEFQFETVSLDLSGNDGTRIVALGLDGDDTLKLLRLKISGYNQSSVGSSVYVDAGTKTVKGVFDIAIIDNAAGPNNITFANAANLTGPFLNRVCGITGAHGMTLTI